MREYGDAFVNGPLVFAEQHHTPPIKGDYGCRVVAEAGQPVRAIRCHTPMITP
jgi:hypothetical protein